MSDNDTREGMEVMLCDYLTRQEFLAAWGCVYVAAITDAIEVDGTTGNEAAELSAGKRLEFGAKYLLRNGGWFTRLALRPNGEVGLKFKEPVEPERGGVTNRAMYLLLAAGKDVPVLAAVQGLIDYVRCEDIQDRVAYEAMLDCEVMVAERMRAIASNPEIREAVLRDRHEAALAAQIVREGRDADDSVN